MRRLKYPLYILHLLIIFYAIPENIFCIAPDSVFGRQIQDTILYRQVLYNGRTWRNSTDNIEGDPYFFSKEFLYGSVTISGLTFEGSSLLYDIYKDEVIILTDRHNILILNKELMNGFTLNYNNQVYRFVKLGTDTLNILNGYVNELYGGNSAVYVKYRKMIQIKAVDNTYDAFYQTQKVYIVKDGVAHQVNNRKQLLSLYKEDKQKILDFIRSNKIKINAKRSESLVPVAEFYDSLKR